MGWFSKKKVPEEVEEVHETVDIERYHHQLVLNRIPVSFILSLDFTAILNSIRVELVTVSFNLDEIGLLSEDPYEKANDTPLVVLSDPDTRTLQLLCALVAASVATEMSIDLMYYGESLMKYFFAHPVEAWTKYTYEAYNNCAEDWFTAQPFYVYEVKNLNVGDSVFPSLTYFYDFIILVHEDGTRAPTYCQNLTGYILCSKRIAGLTHTYDTEGRVNPLKGEDEVDDEF